MKKLTWLLLFGLPGYTFLSIFRLIYFKKPEFDALVKISKIQLYPFNYKILHRKKILEFQKSYPAKVDFFNKVKDPIFVKIHPRSFVQKFLWCIHGITLFLCNYLGYIFFKLVFTKKDFLNTVVHLAYLNLYPVNKRIITKKHFEEYTKLIEILKL